LPTKESNGGEAVRTIGYVRVSTHDQADNGVSLDAQEAKIRAWAELVDAEGVEIFRDEGISGKRSDNRPGLLAALEAIGAGDALVVHSLSRLSRSTRDTIDLAEALSEKGADLVSLSEKIDTTTAAGKMVFRILAVLAEFERDQISDRVKFTLAHKRAKGEKTGGDVPFGFWSRGGRLYPHPGEQKTVGLIRELADGGMSLRAICRELEAKGVARRRGAKSWHLQTVSNILSVASKYGPSR